jgi:hypothetical protein
VHRCCEHNRVEFASLNARGNKQLPVRIVEPVELYTNDVIDCFARAVRMPQRFTEEEGIAFGPGLENGRLICMVCPVRLLERQVLLDVLSLEKNRGEFPYTLCDSKDPTGSARTDGS